jgi:ubiquinone/menaquinone biosynthesis C-methylase UbiE
MGYFLASGLRKLLQNPRKLVAPHVKPGMTVLDFGSAMGFFSLPLAEAVGAQGKVICVDVEPKMLAVLTRRAAQAGLADRIETHVCPADGLGLDGRADSIDFALAFAVMHELADQNGTLSELAQVLKPGAALLLAEPACHVAQYELERTVAVAEQCGFIPGESLRIRFSRAQLLTRGDA